MILTAETHRRIVSASACLIPALAVAVPSGYAYGTALLLLAALLASPAWIRQPVSPPAARWLLLTFVLMALVWLHGSDWSKGLGVLNKPARYLMAVPCLLYALKFPPRREWLLAGIALGAAAGGLRALFDTAVLGLERPWITPRETANAIQLGNLSGLLGLMCWLQLLVYWPRWHWPRRALVLICCALGLLGSLLSQTRGGWLALALCVPPLLWLLARRQSWRRAGAGTLVLLLLALPLGWRLTATVEQRVAGAVGEVLRYERSGAASSSVGQRLEHWRLAIAMGLDKPLVGWGDAGYQAEKARRVAAGEASAALLDYSHAHNEVLDQFAKRGLIGVAGLALLYAVPLWLLWPRRRRAPVADAAESGDRLCLRLIGVSVPLAFAGFGLTQTYFAHYNGVVIYLMLVTLLFAALNDRPSPAPPER